MVKSKRLRVFAGPNGSGKTTLANKLIENGEFNASAFVNADEIEREIGSKNGLDFSQYHLTLELNPLKQYFQNYGMSLSKTEDDKIPEKFATDGGRLKYSGIINSYIASDLAAYVREQLLANGENFWFETVFSHTSKLEIMKKARDLGYRIYFYFIATDAPEINIDRVNNRVAKNGHPVPEDKIRSRYYRSLDLLLPAIKISDRAFLFDNSQKASRYLCEIAKGQNVTMKTKDVPNWFIDFVYGKK